MITPDSLKKLRQAAQKATPGPWEAVSCAVCLPERNWQQEILGVFEGKDDKTECGKLNAEFVAAANPQMVLELIEENARLHQELEDANEKQRQMSGEKAFLERQFKWLLSKFKCTTKMQYMSKSCPATSSKTLEAKSDIKPCGLVGSSYYTQEECANLWRELSRKAVEESSDRITG